MAIIAVAMAAGLLFLWLGTAHADSTTPTYSAIVPPGQFVELVREINGRGPEGVGYYRRAGRIVEGTTFTDRILLQNSQDTETRWIEVEGYFSSSTLGFANWSAPDGWVMIPTNKPDGYKLRYDAPLGPAATVELSVSFLIKDNSHWPRFTNPRQVPQAEHAISYTFSYPQLARGGSEKVLSDLVALEPGTYYAWGTGNDRFRQFQNRGGQEKPIFTAQVHNPFVVSSRDSDVPSTKESFGGAVGDACETQISPDIRTGEVRLRQGFCELVRLHYPYTNRIGVNIPQGKNACCLFGPLGDRKHGWKIFEDEVTSELVFQIHRSYPFTPTSLRAEVRIPRSQALEITYHSGWSQQYRTFYAWYYQGQWNYGRDVAMAGLDQPLWSLWNLNKVRVEADGTVVYTELPFRRPS